MLSQKWVEQYTVVVCRCETNDDVGTDENDNNNSDYVNIQGLTVSFISS